MQNRPTFPASRPRASNLPSPVTAASLNRDINSPSNPRPLFSTFSSYLRRQCSAFPPFSADIHPRKDAKTQRRGTLEPSSRSRSPKPCFPPSSTNPELPDSSELLGNMGNLGSRGILSDSLVKDKVFRDGPLTRLYNGASCHFSSMPLPHLSFCTSGSRLAAKSYKSFFLPS